MLPVSSRSDRRWYAVVLHDSSRPTPAYCATDLFYLLEYIALILVLWFAAVTFGNLQTFQVHDTGVLILFFFAWGNVMIAFSFLISTLFSDAKTCVVFTFVLMMLSVVCGDAINWGYVGQGKTLEHEPFDVYMLLPTFVAFRGIWWLAQAGANYQSLTWTNLDTFANGVMARVFLAFAWQWCACLALTWYFENVLACGAGVRQHPLFFLRPICGWLPCERVEVTATATGDKGVGPSGDDEPADVVAERERVRSDEALPVRLLDLRKVFGAHSGGPPKVALAGLTLGVNKRECLGMLGHNGAGKVSSALLFLLSRILLTQSTTGVFSAVAFQTTAINMLCGLYGPSDGDARVLGLSIRTDMAAIHSVMGVCPQHDVLWKDLTAKEHVVFYARLRLVPHGTATTRAVKHALAAVALSAWANSPTRSFSGGMKRRLSVACALVGNPRIVYLDEPSTGLDPASRRRLWKVITDFKKAAVENAIVLTTVRLRVCVYHAPHALCARAFIPLLHETALDGGGRGPL